MVEQSINEKVKSKIEMPHQPITQWIEDNHQDGDLIRVYKRDGVFALHAVRVNSICIISIKVKSES